METQLKMLLITSSIGALQSFFFGVYLFTIRKGKNIANILLALLLVAFAIRIIKSVSYYFATGHIIPDLLMNAGFACNLLSEAINRKSGSNFPDFINSYRIKETQQLLQCKEWQDKKIAAIAYEVGFNSISVFNAAFKKFTGQTPSAYRKNLTV